MLNRVVTQRPEITQALYKQSFLCCRWACEAHGLWYTEGLGCWGEGATWRSPEPGLSKHRGAWSEAAQNVETSVPQQQGSPPRESAPPAPRGSREEDLLRPSLQGRARQVSVPSAWRPRQRAQLKHARVLTHGSRIGSLCSSRPPSL